MIINNNQQREEIKEVRQVKKEHKKIGSIRPHKGHALFKMNKDGIFKVTENEFEKYFDYEKRITKKKLIVEEDTVYVAALNMKNAIKKFSKLFQPPNGA